jgi:putative phosphoesterase
MSRLGIISDTHGDARGWGEARRVWGEVEAVLHAGDVLYHGPRNPLPEAYGPKALAKAMNESPVPLFIARGNCDAPVDQNMLRWPLLSPLVPLWWEGKFILLSHGEDFTKLRELALHCGASLVITGHTHVASVQREESTIFLNPGSASLPKGRDPASAALLDSREILIFTLQGDILHREPW